MFILPNLHLTDPIVNFVQLPSDSRIDSQGCQSGVRGNQRQIKDDRRRLDWESDCCVETIYLWLLLNPSSTKKSTATHKFKSITRGRPNLSARIYLTEIRRLPDLRPAYLAPHLRTTRRLPFHPLRLIIPTSVPSKFGPVQVRSLIQLQFVARFCANARLERIARLGHIARLRRVRLGLSSAPSVSMTTRRLPFRHIARVWCPACLQLVARLGRDRRWWVLGAIGVNEIQDIFPLRLRLQSGCWKDGTLADTALRQA